jgi:hypothetical protein
VASSTTTGPHGFQLPAGTPSDAAPPSTNFHAPINCTSKPMLKTSPKVGAVLSNHAAIGPWPMAGVGLVLEKLKSNLLIDIFSKSFLDRTGCIGIFYLGFHTNVN